MSRDEAIETVMIALSSPMFLMSKPAREDLFKSIEEHDLTVKEVLEYRLEKSR